MSLTFVMSAIARTFSTDNNNAPCYALMGVTRRVFCSWFAWVLAAVVARVHPFMVQW